MPARRSPQAASPGSASKGFDFTARIRPLVVDIAARVPELRHVDPSRVAIGFSQIRRSTRHGLYASLTPLRFAGGAEHTVRRGRRWTVQRLYDTAGKEMLYILTFYLPRFLDLPWREKLATVVHELWHIGPAFDGDLRRHRGRCYAHGSSKQDYDALVARLTDRYLRLAPSLALDDLLHHDFRQLVARYGKIYGTKFPAPKLLPLDK
jgi:predicted metallopeptidase